MADHNKSRSARARREGSVDPREVRGRDREVQLGFDQPSKKGWYDPDPFRHLGKYAQEGVDERKRER